MGYESFVYELEYAINKYSKENDSNTPDFILAVFLYECLQAWNKACNKRNDWYGIKKEKEAGIIIDRKTHPLPDSCVRAKINKSEELVEKFNVFIKKWCGDNYAHLIDSDENDGEKFRDEIRELF